MNQRTESSRSEFDAAVRNGCWRFGDCSFDGRRLELRRAGQAVALEPKPLELLMLLLRHAGEVVTKDELLESLWPGRIPSESVLTKCVAKLRAALGDDAQQLIKTVHGFGYRLAAAVTAEPGEAAAPPADGAPQAGDSPPLRPQWKLAERLGAGGSAEVWLAEHAKTRDRRVFKFARDAASLAALKREITLCRVLRDTLGERADFVHLLDWNLEEPPCFLEFEHAAGGSLPQWAGSRGGLLALPLELRLGLAADIAETLSAAHGAGVLHKDLKPSNVLVAEDAAGRPRIKLADFGSGNVLSTARLEQLDITRLGFTQPANAADDAGTPLYLAPELLSGQMPTARSDVYALGVMLYQLAVGDFRKPLAPGWEQDIADELLREDIAAAAAGNPAQRLGDAEQVAWRLRQLDQRRRDRSALHRREREAERLRLQLERARARRGLQRAVLAVLVLGLAVSAAGFRHARQQQRLAQASAAEAQAAVAFLAEDVLAATDPFGGGRPLLTIKGLLDEAAPKLPQRLADYAGARAEMGLAMARAYEGLGEWPKARERLELALQDAAADGGAESDLALRIEERLGYLSMLQSRYAESERHFRRVYQARLAQHGALHADTLAGRDGLAWLLYERGRFGDAAAAYEALIADYRKAGIGDHSSPEWSLADCYLELNRFAESEALIRGVIAATERSQGAQHPRTLWQRYTLGDTLMMQGRWDEAAQVFESAYDGLASTVGELHPYTLTALHYRGTLLLERGQPEAALPLLRRAYEGRAQIHGADHTWTRYSANRVGEALTRLGLGEPARQLLEAIAQQAEKAQGPNHPNVLSVRINLADAIVAAGDYAAAAAVLDDIQARAAGTLDPSNLRIGELHLVRARLHQAQGDPAAAQAEFAAARGLFERALGRDHPRTLAAR